MRYDDIDAPTTHLLRHYTSNTSNACIDYIRCMADFITWCYSPLALSPSTDDIYHTHMLYLACLCAHIHIAVFVRRKTWSRFLARDDYVEQIRRDREQTSADDSEDTDDKGDKNQRQTTTTTKQEEEGGLSEQAATLKVS